MTTKTKSRILSLIYESLNEREKELYFTDIENLKSIHSIQISLIDFFRLQTTLEKLKRANIL